MEGAPVLVRYNATVREYVGHPELPIKLGFTVPLNRPNDDGLPDSTENAELDSIEDIIVRRVASTTRGTYVLALTTGVMKEFVFYVEPGADIESLHQEIIVEVSSHDVQCIADKEPKWESYRAFVP